MIKRNSILGLLLLPLCGALAAEPQTRWVIADDGAIVWNVKRHDAHQDNIEMSGKKVSVIVTYGVDDAGKFTTSKHVVFPTFRMVPVNTRSHLSAKFSEDDSPRVFLDRAAPSNEVTGWIRHKGVMTAGGTMGRNKEIAWTRAIFPSTDKPMILDVYSFTNHSAQDAMIEVKDAGKTLRTAPEKGLNGAAWVVSGKVLDPGEKTLKPGQGISLAVVYSARGAQDPELSVNVSSELRARQDLIESYWSKLRLETPDPVLNAAFAFAKIRAAESIYLTKGGYMHGPGGGRYYAAIWANDQAEYANPFFPFLGDPVALESATNAYRMFANYMNPEYKRIPSSIVAEGTSFWNGAKDRGDMAMIAYGASRFALANGGKAQALQLWPLIEWCLEYCHRQINADGVVASDSDELEGRFPAGKANLCTSSLYYDALNSAAMLGRELGVSPAQLNQYADEARALREAIGKYFSANVEGFETYRYYNSNTVLRAWICIPLTVGIFDRKEGTINALFSPRLWTPDGLATQAGAETFWDRSTLYALRGVFAAGATDKALAYLKYYSSRRLLGEHVPYAVEAYPEGNQSHLSAESALYCRIYTEGMFGIRPTGFRSFACTPRLPPDWPAMSLKSVRAFNSNFDLNIARTGARLQIQLMLDGKPARSVAADEGQTVNLSLSE